MDALEQVTPGDLVPRAARAWPGSLSRRRGIPTYVVAVSSSRARRRGAVRGDDPLLGPAQPAPAAGDQAEQAGDLVAGTTKQPRPARQSAQQHRVAGHLTSQVAAGSSARRRVRGVNGDRGARMSWVTRRHRGGSASRPTRGGARRASPAPRSAVGRTAVARATQAEAARRGSWFRSAASSISNTRAAGPHASSVSKTEVSSRPPGACSASNARARRLSSSTCQRCSGCWSRALPLSPAARRTRRAARGARRGNGGPRRASEQVVVSWPSRTSPRRAVGRGHYVLGGPGHRPVAECRDDRPPEEVVVNAGRQ